MTIVHRGVGTSFVYSVLLYPVSGSDSEMEDVFVYKYSEEEGLIAGLTWHTRGIFLFDFVKINKSPKGRSVIESVLRPSGCSTLRIEVKGGAEDVKTSKKVYDWYADHFLSSAKFPDGRTAIAIPPGFKKQLISKGLSRLTSEGKIEWSLEEPDSSDQE